MYVGRKMNRENQKQILEVKDDKITEGQENFEPTQTTLLLYKNERRGKKT